MTDRCLYARTDSGADYPEFLNLTLMENGNYRIMVRSRGEPNPSAVELTPDEFAIFLESAQQKS